MQNNIVKYKKMIDNGAVVVDIRSPVLYSKDHLENSINIPLRNISQLMTIGKNKKILFVSSNDKDLELQQVKNYSEQMNVESYVVGDFNKLK